MLKNIAHTNKQILKYLLEEIRKINLRVSNSLECMTRMVMTVMSSITAIIEEFQEQTTVINWLILNKVAVKNLV